jgi:hypothetical protein
MENIYASIFKDKNYSEQAYFLLKEIQKYGQTHKSSNYKPGEITKIVLNNLLNDIENHKFYYMGEHNSGLLKLSIEKYLGIETEFDIGLKQEFEIGLKR